jgi:hypothetical protein
VEIAEKNLEDLLFVVVEGGKEYFLEGLEYRGKIINNNL